MLNIKYHLIKIIYLLGGGLGVFQKLEGGEMYALGSVFTPPLSVYAPTLFLR